MFKMYAVSRKSYLQEELDTMKQNSITKLNKKVEESAINSTVTQYSKSGDFEYVKTNYALITKDDVLNSAPSSILRKIEKLRCDGKLVLVENNPSEKDFEFMKFLESGRNNSKTIAFKSKSSNSIRIQKYKDLIKENSFSNSYFIDATVKEMSRNTSTRKKETLNGIYYQSVSYVNTRQGNIQSVNSLMLDIDFHNIALTNKELERTADSIIYFAKETGNPLLLPTAIVVSGRGLQLTFMLKERIFRHGVKKHQRVIDSLLRQTRKQLIDVYNKDILSNIEIGFDIKMSCDTNGNPINQKRRLPGTLNFSSGTYAYTYYLNKENLFHMGEFLEYYKGSYEDYLEKVKEDKERIKNERKKASSKKKKNGNNGNGRNNILNTLQRRIDEIAYAMKEVSKIKPEGWRNNAYFTLVCQYLNLQYYKNSLNDEVIASLLIAVDDTLVSPQFSSKQEAINFVNSSRISYESFRNKYFSNKSIEDFCEVLRVAKAEGIPLNYFFKETKTSTRERRLQESKERRNKRIEMIENEFLKGSSISNISRMFNLSRTYVYKLIKAFAKKLGLRIIKGRFDAIKILNRIKAKILLKIKNEKASEKHPNPMPPSHSLLLFNTEKVNKDKKQDENHIFSKQNTVNILLSPT